MNLLLLTLSCSLALFAPPVADEAQWLGEATQLTSPERFLKAGEGYFSPDGSKIIFQAIEVPSAGTEADEFYAMFVADTVRDDAGHTTGITNVRRISPPGSANTCGWFHPKESNVVLFATTMGPPSDADAPGYQRGTGRYRWQFPPSMRIVITDLRVADGTADPLKPIAGDGTAYTAEGALSPDGRHLIYSTLESGQGDLRVKDLKTGKFATLVSEPGYDGGPFFSPEGTRIAYRSDRHNNNLLQLFVADLAFDEDGAITGITHEHQLTDDTNVNWCPFWHPAGEHLVFGTSAVSHRNYDIFIVDAAASAERSRYGTGIRRVTTAEGADVLPVFNHDGTEMMWTSKRGPDDTSQLWVAPFVGDLSPPSATAVPGGH